MNTTSEYVWVPREPTEEMLEAAYPSPLIDLGYAETIKACRKMAANIYSTLIAAAPRVSDQSLQGQDAQRLDPKDESAVPERQTPVSNPSGDVEGLVERLNNAEGHDCRDPSHMELIAEAAQALLSPEDRIKAVVAERDEERRDHAMQVQILLAEKATLQSRIDELTRAQACADRDIAILIGQVRAMEELSEESLEAEDEALVSQIDADLRARTALIQGGKSNV